MSAVIGIVDTMVAARASAAKYGYGVSPNRELVALGAGNLLATFLVGSGGVPVFGSISRTSA